MQETKIVQEDVEYLDYLCKKEGLDVLTSYNISRCRGVAVIAPRKFGITLVLKDEEERRRITVKCNETGGSIFVTCVYAPVEHKEKREWLTEF